MDQTLTTHLLNCWQRNLLQNLSVQYYTSHCKTHEIPPVKKKKHPTPWLVGSPNHTSCHTYQDFHDVNSRVLWIRIISGAALRLWRWSVSHLLSFHTSWNRCVFFLQNSTFSQIPITGLKISYRNFLSLKISQIFMIHCLDLLTSAFGAADDASLWKKRIEQKYILYVM